MTNRSLVLAVVVTLAVASMAALVWAQPPPAGGQGGPGGGGRGMGQAMMYFERAWTAVCFQIALTDQQEQALRPTFASALDARTKALDAARAARDRQATQKAFEDCKATLDAKLKEVLTPAQLDALQKLLAPPQRQGQGQQPPMPMPMPM